MMAYPGGTDTGHRVELNITLSPQAANQLQSAGPHPSAPQNTQTSGYPMSHDSGVSSIPMSQPPMATMGMPKPEQVSITPYPVGPGQGFPMPSQVGPGQGVGFEGISPIGFMADEPQAQAYPPYSPAGAALPLTGNFDMPAPMTLPPKTSASSGSSTYPPPQTGYPPQQSYPTSGSPYPPQTQASGRPYPAEQPTTAQGTPYPPQAGKQTSYPAQAHHSMPGPYPPADDLAHQFQAKASLYPASTPQGSQQGSPYPAASQSGAQHGSPYPPASQSGPQHGSPYPPVSQSGPQHGSPYPPASQSGAQHGSPYPPASQSGPQHGSPYPPASQSGAQHGSPYPAAGQQGQVYPSQAKSQSPYPASSGQQGSPYPGEPQKPAPYPGASQGTSSPYPGGQQDPRSQASPYPSAGAQQAGPYPPATTQHGSPYPSSQPPVSQHQQPQQAAPTPPGQQQIHVSINTLPGGSQAPAYPSDPQKGGSHYPAAAPQTAPYPQAGAPQQMGASGTQPGPLPHMGHQGPGYQPLSPSAPPPGQTNPSPHRMAQEHHHAQAKHDDKFVNQPQLYQTPPPHEPAKHQHIPHDQATKAVPITHDSSRQSQLPNVNSEGIPPVPPRPSLQASQAPSHSFDMSSQKGMAQKELSDSLRSVQQSIPPQQYQPMVQQQAMSQDLAASQDPGLRGQSQSPRQSYQGSPDLRARDFGASQDQSLRGQSHSPRQSYQGSPDLRARPGPQVPVDMSGSASPKQSHHNMDSTFQKQPSMQGSYSPNHSAAHTAGNSFQSQPNEQLMKPPVRQNSQSAGTNYEPNSAVQAVKPPVHQSQDSGLALYTDQSSQGTQSPNLARPSNPKLAQHRDAESLIIDRLSSMSKVTRQDSHKTTASDMSWDNYLDNQHSQDSERTVTPDSSEEEEDDDDDDDYHLEDKKSGSMDTYIQEAAALDKQYEMLMNRPLDYQFTWTSTDQDSGTAGQPPKQLRPSEGQTLVPLLKDKLNLDEVLKKPPNKPGLATFDQDKWGSATSSEFFQSKQESMDLPQMTTQAAATRRDAFLGQKPA